VLYIFYVVENIGCVVFSGCAFQNIAVKFEGKSISKLQMDIELKKTRVLI
jgi:hypothetical protein